MSLNVYNKAVVKNVGVLLDPDFKFDNSVVKSCFFKLRAEVLAVF